MSRRSIVAANWKMNTDRATGLALLVDVLNGLGPDPRCEVVVAPPFPLLGPASDLLLRDGRIILAAQNCHPESSGAYTGEVSAPMLASFGISYVIVGHSERRQFFGEDDALIGQKARASIEAGMGAIYCCGETLAQRESGSHFEVVEAQLSRALAGFGTSDLLRLVVAYEPVWAIGTGRSASPAEAQEMHHFIRQWLVARLSDAAAEVPILYGGSVRPDNAAELFSQLDIDGGLIGGASLNAAQFLAIVNALSK